MRKILLAVAAAGLVGCVGGIDTPTVPNDPPPGSVGDGPGGPAAGMARSMFETNVYPTLARAPAAGARAAAPAARGPAVARWFFETTVYPILAGAARCIQCHSSAGPVGNV